MSTRNENLDRYCSVIIGILESNHLQHAGKDVEINSNQLRDKVIEKGGMSTAVFYKSLSYLVGKQYVKKQVNSDRYRTVTYSINEEKW